MINIKKVNDTKLIPKEAYNGYVKQFMSIPKFKNSNNIAIK